MNSEHKLPGATRLGTVVLNVRKRESLAEFYAWTLGLKPQGSPGKDTTALGFGGEDLIHLVEDPQAVEGSRHASLYHFCLAVEQRQDLGWWLRRILDSGFDIDGLVDHRMAEAIYFEDPEGNGVELNWDRPRSEWRPWSEWLAMGNAPLDTTGLLEANEKAGPREAPAATTRVGHLHLHVGDLAASEAFFCGGVGLDKTAEVPGQAIFTSAGGYHHHIAFNVWKGRVVAPQPLNAFGLKHATLVLPKPADVDAAGAALKSAGYAVEAQGSAIFTRDPSGHGLLLRPE